MKNYSPRFVKQYASLLILGFMLAITVLPAGCSRDSPEEGVRMFISKAEVYAQEGNVGKVRDLISDDYSDSSGRTKKELVRYVTYQILSKRSIHLFTRITTTSFAEDGSASVELLVAMTGKPVISESKLRDMQADIYAFSLTLTPDGSDWLLSSAHWQPAMLEDLLPQ